MRHLASLLLFAACGPAPISRAAPQPTRAPLEVAAPTALPAPSASEDAPVARALVWVVTDLGEADEDAPVRRHRIDLEVRTGEATQTVHVGEAVGSMMAPYQHVCHAMLAEDDRVYPVGPQEIAKIAFFYAGADIFAVRHRGGHDYAVVHAVDGHEECASGPCRLPEEVVTTFEASFGSEPDESIVLLNPSEPGSKRPFDCGAG